MQSDSSDDLWHDTMSLQWFLSYKTKIEYCVRQVCFPILKEQFETMRADDSRKNIVSGASNIDDILEDDDDASPLQISDCINLCDADGCFELKGGKIYSEIGVLIIKSS